MTTPLDPETRPDLDAIKALYTVTDDAIDFHGEDAVTEAAIAAPSLVREIERLTEERDLARQDVVEIAHANVMRIGEWEVERRQLAHLLGAKVDSTWRELKEWANHVVGTVVGDLVRERDAAVGERDALRELLAKERAESERLRAEVRVAELFGTAFIWRHPGTGEELVLHPADVTVVIPDGQLTEIEQLRATAERDAHIISLLRRFVAEGFTAGTGSAGADLAAAVDLAYPEGGQP